MTTPEGKLKAYLVKRSRELGLYAYKLSFENRRGAPDWMVCGNSKLCFIELKTSSGALSAAQKKVLSELGSSSGCKVWVCRTENQIDGALAGLCYV